jgi:hypothetical protein
VSFARRRVSSLGDLLADTLALTTDSPQSTPRTLRRAEIEVSQRPRRLKSSEGRKFRDRKRPSHDRPVNHVKSTEYDRGL